MQSKWTALPFTYNAQKVIKYHHPELWRFQELHIIHYVDAKPWDRLDPSHSLYQELVDFWWDTFCERPSAAV